MNWKEFIKEKKLTFPVFTNALQHQESLLQALDFSTDHLAAALGNIKHGLQPTWEQAYLDLNQLIEKEQEISRKVDQKISLLPEFAENSCARQSLTQILQNFKPWRKGPFDFFGIFIDSEWRSDVKWQRLKSLGDWSGQSILDVGCGNGYFLWQLEASGAKNILGIDPSLHYFYQFLISYLPKPIANLGFLPLPLEAVTPRAVFDSVLSMGVLYHRRAPLEHLALLGKFLKKNGLLFIETLIIEDTPVLFPQDTYAGMPNVWCIPSLKTLNTWMQRLDFSDFTVYDLSPTTSLEQRRTPWIDSFSLGNFLDPSNPNKTIEGYHAPLRALISVRHKNSG